MAPGQELSTDVFPSEDELLEALISGEIDYDQYILLLDIAQHGIDSVDLHLLDLIPNLSSLSGRSNSSDLESEQQELFVASNNAPASRVRYRYYRALDSDEQSRYRIDSRVKISDDWRAAFGIRKELSGRERCVERSLTYKRDHGLLRRLTFGSVTERFGLGSVVGYRGKILRYSDALDGESFLYPDNGGFNGVSFDLQPHGWRIRGIASYVRDSATSLRAFAAIGERAVGAIRPYIAVGSNHLHNRATGNSLDDIKLAGGFSARYRRGHVALEYCVQADADRASGAFLVEGVHRLLGTRLEYAGWRYGDRYLDFTAGGRAAAIQTHIELPEVGFTLSSRRPGQGGVQLKGNSELNQQTRLFSSLVVARRNHDSSNVQWLEGLEHDLSRRMSIRVDYLHSDKERDATGGEDDRFIHRIRTEARIATDKLKIRTYLAFSSTSSYGDYVSLFASARFMISSRMGGEVWSNVSRIAQGNVDYWYWYGKLDQRLADGYSFALKLSHRYDRRATVRNSSAVSLEMETAW